jgi:tubulin-folding cofactor B
MSEEDYASRDNTYRKYKEAKLKEDPSWTLEKEMCMRRGTKQVSYNKLQQQCLHLGTPRAC